mgnify:CR=1 FL=1
MQREDNTLVVTASNFDVVCSSTKVCCGSIPGTRSKKDYSTIRDANLKGVNYIASSAMVENACHLYGKSGSKRSTAYYARRYWTHSMPTSTVDSSVMVLREYIATVASTRFWLRSRARSEECVLHALLNER